MFSVAEIIANKKAEKHVSKKQQSVVVIPALNNEKTFKLKKVTQNRDHYFVHLYQIRTNNHLKM